MNENKPGNGWKDSSFNGLEAETFDKLGPISEAVFWPTIKIQRKKFTQYISFEDYK